MATTRDTNGEQIGSVVRVEAIARMAIEASLNLVRVQSRPTSASDGIRRHSGAYGVGYGVELGHRDDAARLHGRTSCMLSLKMIRRVVPNKEMTDIDSGVTACHFMSWSKLGGGVSVIYDKIKSLNHSLVSSYIFCSYIICPKTSISVSTSRWISSKPGAQGPDSVLSFTLSYRHVYHKPSTHFPRAQLEEVRESEVQLLRWCEEA